MPNHKPHTCINVGSLLIRPQEQYCNKLLVKIQILLLTGMHLKMLFPPNIIKIQTISTKGCFWKCCLPTGSHIVQASMYLVIIIYRVLQIYIMYSWALPQWPLSIFVLSHVLFQILNHARLYYLIWIRLFFFSLRKNLLVGVSMICALWWLRHGPLEVILVLSGITWANVEPDLCRHMASLGHNELKLHYRGAFQKHLWALKCKSS